MSPLKLATHRKQQNGLPSHPNCNQTRGVLQQNPRIIRPPTGSLSTFMWRERKERSGEKWEPGYECSYFTAVFQASLLEKLKIINFKICFAFVGLLFSFLDPLDCPRVVLRADACYLVILIWDVFSINWFQSWLWCLLYSLTLEPYSQRNNFLLSNNSCYHIVTHVVSPYVYKPLVLLTELPSLTPKCREFMSSPTLLPSQR